MKIQRLNENEIDLALVRFNHDFNTCFISRTETEKLSIMEFVKQNNLRVLAYSLRPDAIKSVTQAIFLSKEITEFVFDLSFRYFTLNGKENDFIYRLSRSLTQGLMVDGYQKERCAIPDPIANSCPNTLFELPLKWYQKVPVLNLLFPIKSTEDSITEFLATNRYLLITYLCQLTAIDNVVQEIYSSTTTTDK